MTERAPFEKGMKFMIPAEILSGPDSDGEYNVQFIYNIDYDGEISRNDVYMNTAAIADALPEDEPLHVGEDVVHKNNPEKVGRLMSISKGHGWVDWEPESTDYAGSAIPITNLRRPSPPEEE